MRPDWMDKPKFSDPYYVGIGIAVTVLTLLVVVAPIGLAAWLVLR